MRNQLWVRRVSLAAASAFLIMGYGTPTLAASKTTTAAKVTVISSKIESTVAPTALGMNVATWDPFLYSKAVPARLQSLGIQLLRWPGGSFSDTYHWATQPGALSQFGQLMHHVHSGGIVTVNYGTGTPSEAAAEVRYANVTHHYGIKYWEIGNEVYGDGAYQNVTWEANVRPNKGPAAYARNVLKFARAMRAVDPNIKIGVVQTVPGVWPSGIPPYWDRTVLPIVGKAINFVVLHWYPQNPGQENDQTLLQDPNAIPGYMSTMKQYLRQYAGSNAKHIQILVDETNNVSSQPDKQTVSLVNALFLAKDYNTWLENGAANVSWWDLHNSRVNAADESSSLYGTTTYGDYGILSVGAPGEPALNRPFPAYFGYRLVHFLVAPKDQYVASSSNQPLVSSYAVKGVQGTMQLMLINTSRSATYQITYQGLKGWLGAPATVRFYGMGSSQLATRFSHFTGQIKIPPYSITEVTLARPIK